MTKQLPVWLFLLLSIALIGVALAPILRVVLSIDANIQASYLTTITLLIGGLMCGLTAMILMSRKPTAIGSSYAPNDPKELRQKAALLHLSGLLILTCIPLLNFLLCFVLWLRWRDQSAWLDFHGREAINFQIAVYLYLLMSLFLAYILVGFFLALFVLLLAVVLALTAALAAWQGRAFAYPASMAVISRHVPSAAA